MDKSPCLAEFQALWEKWRSALPPEQLSVLSLEVARIALCTSAVEGGCQNQVSQAEGAGIVEEERRAA